MYIENKVNNLIHELSINDVDFSIDGISSFLGIFVTYNEHMSCYLEYRKHSFIYIKKGSTREMWEDFTHELGHYLLHDTDQRKTNDMLNYKQENEADKFSLLFRMPQQIIEDYELFSENEIMSFFNEVKESARKRLEMLYNYYCATSPVG